MVANFAANFKPKTLLIEPLCKGDPGALGGPGARRLLSSAASKVHSGRCYEDAPRLTAEQAFSSGQPMVRTPSDFQAICPEEVRQNSGGYASDFRAFTVRCTVELAAIIFEPYFSADGHLAFQNQIEEYRTGRRRNIGYDADLASNGPFSRTSGRSPHER